MRCQNYYNLILAALMQYNLGWCVHSLQTENVWIFLRGLNVTLPLPQISHFSGSSSTQNPGEVENSGPAVLQCNLLPCLHHSVMMYRLQPVLDTALSIMLLLVFFYTVSVSPC